MGKFRNINLALLVILSLVSLASAVHGEDADMALIENRLNDTLLCIAGNQISQSAVTWIANITSDWKEPRSKLRNQSGDDWNCELPEGSCYLTPVNDDYWKLVTSLHIADPLPHLTDYRWEGLPQIITDDNGTVRLLTSIPYTTHWVDISVRTAHDAHILLCDTNDLSESSSNCHYVILGAQSKTNDPGNEYKSGVRRCYTEELDKSLHEDPKGHCSKLQDRNKDGMISTNHWTHIRMEWGSIFKVTKFGNAKPFLRYNIEDFFSVNTIFVRTWETYGLWKVHNYHLMYTNHTRRYLDSSFPFTRLPTSCLAVQYFLSHEMSLDIELVRNGRDKYKFQDYQLQDDGEWHEVHLTPEASYVELPEQSLSIRITSASTGDSFDGFFGIGNIRTCNSQGEIRMSQWQRGNASCHLLKVENRSLYPDSPQNDQETGCDNGNFMSGCKENCRTLLGRGECSGYAICLPRGNSQLCSCTEGYYGLNCSTECSKGWYGQDCKKNCGKCKNGCHHETGVCWSGGCLPGYNGTKCDTKCSKGWYGQDCKKNCGKCKNGCHHETGVCWWGGCLPGYNGKKCDTKCSIGWYGQDCKKNCRKCKNGCHHETGVCWPGGCLPGYNGTKCDNKCSTGRYGQDCKKNCGKCKNGCQHETGVCWSGGCLPGYNGKKCDTQCSKGWYGQDCKKNCGNCKNGCHHETGVCSLGGCLPGYNGTKCDTKCSKGWYGQDCKKNCGKCKNGCHHETGVCWPGGCLPGYNGTKCDNKCSTGRYGQDCKKNCGKCKNGCQHETGVCWPSGCLPGYNGTKCDTKCSTRQYGQDCKNYCGKCKTGCHHESGVCRLGGCLPGYKGEKCDTQCSTGRYGQDCKKNCGKCKNGCKHETGVCWSGGCLPGYKGRKCDTKCQNGQYGQNCEGKCGKCVGSCNRETGVCSRGCLLGYTDEKCLTGYPYLCSAPQLMSSTSDSLTVSIPDLKICGDGKVSSVKLQYKVITDKDWNPSEVYMMNSRSLPIIKTIDHLQPNTSYQIRVVPTPFEKTGKSYSELKMPLTIASTKCSVPETFRIRPEKYGVVVSINKSAAGQCPAQELRYKIIRALDLTCKNGSLTHSITNIMKLLPYNNYSIEITHNKLLIFNTTFATKESAPSKVQNLTVVAVTATSVFIVWKEPESPNGLIRNYSVVYKHESFLACQRIKRNEIKSRGKMNTTEDNIEIIKLLPFSDYKIEVWATTTEHGAIESIQFSTKGEDIPTETPSLLKPVRRGTTWVTFNLDVSGDCTKIKGPLENTTVIIRGNSSWNENYTVKKEFNTNSINLTHLIPYSSYGVTVYYNRSGNVNLTLPLWFHTLTEASGPPAVKDFTAFSHGPGWISLRWIPPYPPYGILEMYELNWLSKTETIQKTNTCSIWPDYVCATIFQNIKKNTRYTVKIAAINKNNLRGKTEEVTVTTVEEASSSPLNLKAVSTNSSQIILTWQHPWLPRGRLQSFIIETKLISSLLLYIDPSKNTTTKGQLIIEKENLNYNFTVGDLIPSSTYSVELYANSSIKGNSTYTTVNTPAVKPYFNQSILVEEQEVTDHTLTIILPPAPLYWTTNSVELYANSSIKGNSTYTTVNTPAVKPYFNQSILVEEQEVTDHTLTIILPPAPLYRTTNSPSVDFRNVVSLSYINLQAENMSKNAYPVLIEESRRRKHPSKKRGHVGPTCTSFVVVTLLDGELLKTKDQALLVNEELHKEIMKEIENYSGKMSWIAAELQLTPSPEKFIVGQSQQYHGLKATSKFGNQYNNRPLAPRSTYQVHVVAVSLMPTASLFGLVSLAQAVRTKDTPSASSALLALLLLLIIPILCYLVYVRFYKGRKNTKENGIPLLQHQQELGPMKVQYKPDKTLPTFSIIPQQRPGSGVVEFVQQTSRRIPVSMLEQYVRSALVTGEFQRQYAMVPRGLTQPCETGSLPENKPKNRYRGLIPYDATRVVLKNLDQYEFSDYINANFIVGYRYPKFYIAAQGPKANTVADFWQMIWQEEVKIISMLTNIVENGKRKCEKYWPDPGNGVTYGAFTINTISSDVFPDYTFSRLQVTFKGENRLIDHLHFTSWPDHGVPLYPLSLARYLKKILTIKKGPGPILVHCSAGVGRTGTVILADISLRMATEEGAVDVLYFLQKIREYRLNLVDNIEQYTFLHLVLLECLVEESMDIPCDGNFKTQVQTLRDNGGLVRQFLHITRKKEIGGTQTKDIVQRSPHHNRDKSVISGHGGDLIVTQPSMNNVLSTYMNPVYVDGFRVMNQFISTQFPEKKTLGDFWCLVLEKRIPLIIVLNELDFRDKSTVEFQPSASRSICPTPSIEVKQYNLNKQDKWNHHFLEISDNSKDHPQKEKVQLLEFKGWHREESVPSSTNSLLMLWKETESVYTGKGPILVTCRDGVTACGLFLALAFLIEKVKLEKVCDVYHAVKTVCQSRIEFMDRQDQFEYLYDAVIAYLEDVQIYANFQ